VAMDNAEAPTVLGIEIDITSAVSYVSTNTLPTLMSHFLASVEESYRERIRLRQRFDMHGTVRAAIAVGPFPRTGFDALKDRLEARVVPPLTALIGPLIEVGRMPPDPFHRIDA